MSFFKIRLRKTDRLWTQHIRIRDNYTCQRCGQVYSPDNCGNLGVSHYWGRGHENVRFDDDNCVSLCTLPCHPLWAEEDRDEYKAFMIKRLGQTGYDLLEFRKEIRKKRDDAADLIILKHLLKQETAGALIE
ncbi:hypothetical protein MUP77_21005 [Candidatus Bathyarchaeota archaeon]|nr:hypothetical protein [Candidatus Bathyarchaeota archaeon]